MTARHRTTLFHLASIMACSVIVTNAAQAQTAQPPAPAPAQQQQPQQQQFQPSGEWEKLPKMIIERQFAGPLRDTVIQRLRDPVDGTICYLYLPISAPHSLPQSSGFVQYGGNTIGSINCMPAPPQRPAPAAARK